MVKQLHSEDIRFVRMKDEDEDEVIEEDLASCQSTSRLTSYNSTTPTEIANIGIVVRDSLSLHKLANYLINYSINMPEAKIMTQVISSFAFAHSTWFILSPVYKRNVMARGERYASLSFSGVITKNQLAKLCSVINSVLIKLKTTLKYEISMTTDRFSQVMNAKNSLSTIEGEFLQSVSCSINEEEKRAYYTCTAKSVNLWSCLLPQKKYVDSLQVLD